MRGNPHCKWCGGSGEYEISETLHESAGIVPCMHPAEDSAPAPAGVRPAPAGVRPAPERPLESALGGAASGGSGGAGRVAPPGRPAPPAAFQRAEAWVRWEYNLVQMPEGVQVRQPMLARLGDDGWELVCIIHGVAYMKRARYA